MEDKIVKDNYVIYNVSPDRRTDRPSDGPRMKHSIDVILECFDNLKTRNDCLFFFNLYDKFAVAHKKYSGVFNGEYCEFTVSYNMFGHYVWENDCENTPPYEEGGLYVEPGCVDWDNKYDIDYLVDYSQIFSAEEYINDLKLFYSDDYQLAGLDDIDITNEEDED